MAPIPSNVHDKPRIMPRPPPAPQKTAPVDSPPPKPQSTQSKESPAQPPVKDGFDQPKAEQGQKKENEAVKNLKKPENWQKAVDTGLTVNQKTQAAIDNVKSLKNGDGFTKTWGQNFKDSIADGTNPKDFQTKVDKLGKLNNLAKGGFGVKDLAGDKGRNAWKALTSGDLVSGDTAKRDAAVGDVAEGGKTLVETTKVGLETARDGQKYGSAFRAANKELKGLKAGQRLSIANNIAKNAFNKTDAAHVDGRPRNDLFKELKGDVRKHAVDTLLKDKGPNITTEARNQANTIVGHRSEKALKAGITAGSKAAGGPLAKAAGRFVPGANVAIAAFDVANAYKTLKDPKANGVKKTTAVFTALGSTVAATEIPVVSQVGAGVSAVSDLVGSIFG